MSLFESILDFRLAYHSIFITNSPEKPVYVLADDTYVFILLLYESLNWKEAFHFPQGTISSRHGITCHNITALSSHLREKICAILPALYRLSGSDFKQAFCGRSKISSFKKQLNQTENIDSISLMIYNHANVEKTTNFVLYKTK